MLSQRKRYNYLPNCQRPSNCDLPTYSTISSSVKYGSISANKSRILPQTNKQNKENYMRAQQEQVKRIAQLQKLNQKLLDQTTQKFEKLQENLLTVEGILTQKQTCIINISSQNQQLKNQKRELLRILNQKNQIIKNHEKQIQEFNDQSIVIESEDLKQIETQTEVSEPQESKKNCCSETSINTIQSILCSRSSQTQTQKQNKKSLPVVKQRETQTQIQQVPIKKSQKSNQNVQSSSGLNYRQKYEILFKRALQMQDQMYKLKEQLFDAKNQLKTVNQQFNTYKILKQIQTIQKK